MPTLHLVTDAPGTRKSTLISHLATYPCVAADFDEHRSGLRECPQRAAAGLDVVLEASRDRGERPPSLERLLDRTGSARRHGEHSAG